MSISAARFTLLLGWARQYKSGVVAKHHRRRMFLWALLNSSCSRKRKVFERTSSHQRLLNLKGHSIASRACRTREEEEDLRSPSPPAESSPLFRLAGKRLRYILYIYTYVDKCFHFENSRQATEEQSYYRKALI